MFGRGEEAVVDDIARSIDFGSMAEAIWTAKRVVVLTTLVCFLLAIILAFVLPARYTSAVSFLPSNFNSGGSAASAVAGQLALLGGGDLLGIGKNSADTYAGILKSRSVAHELVEKFSLMQVYKVKKESLAEKALGSDTAVSVDLKSSILTVAVTARTPELARDLAAGYMKALQNTNGRLALTEASQRRLFFTEQLAKEKDDLENAEAELQKTQEHSGLIAPAGQTDAEIRTISQIQAQIATRRVDLAALRQSSTNQNAEVIRLQAEIDGLQRELGEMERGGAQQATISIPTARVPALQLDYLRRAREVKYHEALFETLSKQLEAARLDEAREAPLLQVLDPPSLPDTKSSPKRLLICLVGFALGLCSGCIWAIWRSENVLL
jgi:tyrosine-protein kinase Etk/Wzc